MSRRLNYHARHRTAAQSLQHLETEARLGRAGKVRHGVVDTVEHDARVQLQAQKTADRAR